MFRKPLPKSVLLVTIAFISTSTSAHEAETRDGLCLLQQRTRPVTKSGQVPTLQQPPQFYISLTMQEANRKVALDQPEQPLQSSAAQPTETTAIEFPMPQEGRPSACIDRSYNIGEMPTVSVVIPYLHEDFELIKKTVGSLIANTPPKLLDRILFVDDANDKAHGYIENITALHAKVHVHHNKERQGLIKAKVIGASMTTSPVIVFLEPHCIANRQWLEPLLVQLAAEPLSVAVPIVDIIPETDTDSYRYANAPVGGFDWRMTFNWRGGATALNFNQSWEAADPYPMPALSGGLFAITREWWEQSGTYDSQMTEWGGENVEMSLRIWRCGGKIISLPCSRVGHMYRAARPYSFHGEAYDRNIKRLAAVWLDNEMSRAKAKELIGDLSDAGSVAERIALKERLHCKSMDWYLHNVYPELEDESEFLKE